MANVAFLLLFGVNLHVTCSFFFGEEVPADVNSTLLDIFVQEPLTVTCEITTTEHSYWNFYSYHDSRLQVYRPNDETDNRVEVVNINSLLKLQIASTLVSDSGRYDCVTDGRIFGTRKVDVHDPGKMKYILTARGQSPYDDTVMNEFKVFMHWSDWTKCDGCQGNGERRRFGFCRVRTLDGEEHCKSKDVPIFLRPAAKNRPEEILVDMCYDHCIEPIEPVKLSEKRIDLTNYANVRLSCRPGATVRSTVRWERSLTTLKRNDYSFGYAKSRAMYVDKDNTLLLNNVQKPNGGTIRVSCVDDRTYRVTFDLVVEPLPSIGIPTTLDHLRYMALSSCVQFIAFLLILAVYNAARTFTIDTSLEI